MVTGNADKDTHIAVTAVGEAVAGVILAVYGNIAEEFDKSVVFVDVVNCLEFGIKHVAVLEVMCKLAKVETFGYYSVAFRFFKVNRAVDVDDEILSAGLFLYGLNVTLLNKFCIVAFDSGRQFFSAVFNALCAVELEREVVAGCNGRIVLVLINHIGMTKSFTVFEVFAAYGAESLTGLSAARCRAACKSVVNLTFSIEGRSMSYLIHYKQVSVADIAVDERLCALILAGFGYVAEVLKERCKRAVAFDGVAFEVLILACCIGPVNGYGCKTAVAIDYSGERVFDTVVDYGVVIANLYGKGHNFGVLFIVYGVFNSYRDGLVEARSGGDITGLFNLSYIAGDGLCSFAEFAYVLDGNGVADLDSFGVDILTVCTGNGDILGYYMHVCCIVGLVGFVFSNAAATNWYFAALIAVYGVVFSVGAGCFVLGYKRIEVAVIIIDVSYELTANGVVTVYTSIDVFFAVFAVEVYSTNSFGTVACIYGLLAIIGDVAKYLHIGIPKDTLFCIDHCIAVFIDFDGLFFTIHVECIVVAALYLIIPRSSERRRAGVFNRRLAFNLDTVDFDNGAGSHGICILIHGIELAVVFKVRDLLLGIILIVELGKSESDGLFALGASAAEYTRFGKAGSLSNGPNGYLVTSDLFVFADLVCLAVGIARAEVDIYAALLASVLVFGIYKVTFVPNMVAGCRLNFAALELAADFAFLTCFVTIGAAGRLNGCNILPNVLLMFGIGGEPSIAAVVADFEKRALVCIGSSVVFVRFAEYPSADVFVLARFGAFAAAKAFDGNFLGLAVGISYNEALLGFIPGYGSDANAGRALFALFALIAVITSGTLFALFALKIPEVDFFLRAIGIVYDELTIHNAHVDYAFCGVGIAIASGYAEREGYNTAKCAENPENLC